MSEDYPTDTDTWCDEHAVAREACGCGLPIGEDTDDTRRLRLTKASNVAMTKPAWLHDQLIPLRAVTLLAGREGLGKSTMWAYWVALATTGHLASADVTEPTPVLIVANEDAIASTINPRLVAAGADLDLVHYVEVQDPIGSTSVTLPLDGERVIEAAKHTGARLIVVDPLVSVLDGKLDSHKDHSIRQALDPLNRLAERADAAVVGLAHLNKGTDTDPLTRVLGSRAFTAAARSVLVMTRDDEDDTDARRLVIHAKSNLGPRQRDALVVELRSTTITTDDGPADIGAVTVVGTREVHIDDAMTPTSEDDADDISDAGRWLLDYLAREGGEAPSRDVIAAGRKQAFSKDQIKRARRKAGVTAKRTETFPTSTMWHHPDNPPQSVQSVQSEQSGRTREPTAPTVDPQSGRPHHPSPPTAPTALTAPTDDTDPITERKPA